MFSDLTPARLHKIGILLCLAGLGLHLATILIFHSLPLTLEIVRALVWLKAAGWTALGLVVTGGVMLIASMVLQRR